MAIPSLKTTIPVLVCLLLITGGVGAYTGTQNALVSNHDTTTELSNAQTLDGMTVSDGNVTLSTSGSTTDGFEDNDVAEYDGESSFTTTTDAKNGNYAGYFDGSGPTSRVSAYHTDTQGETHVEGWVKDVAGDSGNSVAGLVLQRSSSEQSWYVARIGAPGDPELAKVDQGTQTTLWGGSDSSISEGDWFYVEMWYWPSNSTLKGVFYDSSMNQVASNSVTDSSIPTGGYAGVQGFGSRQSKYDDITYGSGTGQVSEGTYIGQYHTVENAASAKIEFPAIDNATVDVTVNDRNGNQLGSATYTTPGTKTIALSGQTHNDIATNVTTTAETGDTSFKLDAEGITFTNTAPTVDNTTASPTGTLNSQTPTFSIDVSDPDFDTTQGDTVNASLYVSGEYRGSDKLTSNGTASVSATVSGTNTYHWEVTDAYGGEGVSDTYNINTPEILYVYNETTPHTLIDNIQVNATVTGSGDTVSLTQVGDGKISLSGLDTTEEYVFTLSAEGYYPREIYISDLFDQASVYMLPKSTSSVENTITVDDRTGEFGSGTVILVDRVINTSTVADTPDEGPKWVTIGGDRLGTSGFYAVNLHQYGRYRFRVRNQRGDTRVLGEYTAKTSGPVNLEIGDVSYSLGEGGGSYEWDATLTNVTGGNYSITYAYNDHTDRTENVSVEIRTRENGTVVGSKSFENGPYGEVVYTIEVDKNDVENKSYVVDWVAYQNGTKLTGKRLVSGKNTLDYPIADLWKSVAYGAGVLILAFLIGAGAGPAPALVTIGIFSAFGVYIGLAPADLGFGSTVLVITMGAIYTLQNTRDVV